MCKQSHSKGFDMKNTIHQISIHSVVTGPRHLFYNGFKIVLCCLKYIFQNLYIIGQSSGNICPLPNPGSY